MVGLEIQLQMHVEGAWVERGDREEQVSFGIHQGEEVKASIKANLDRKRQ